MYKTIKLYTPNQQLSLYLLVTLEILDSRLTLLYILHLTKPSNYVTTFLDNGTIKCRKSTE